MRRHNSFDQNIKFGFFLTIIFCTKKTIFIVFLGAFVDPLATAVVVGILVLILQFYLFLFIRYNDTATFQTVIVTDAVFLLLLTMPSMS